MQKYLFSISITPFASNYYDVFHLAISDWKSETFRSDKEISLQTAYLSRQSTFSIILLGAKCNFGSIGEYSVISSCMAVVNSRFLKFMLEDRVVASLELTLIVYALLNSRQQIITYLQK